MAPVLALVDSDTQSTGVIVLEWFCVDMSHIPSDDEPFVTAVTQSIHHLCHMQVWFAGLYKATKYSKLRLKIFNSFVLCFSGCRLDVQQAVNTIYNLADVDSIRMFYAHHLSILHLYAPRL